MLSLDDPRWKTLRHAYGRADSTPTALRRLRTDGSNPKLVEELWSSLWHQGGEAYPAACAAIPHIVEATAKMPPGDQLAWLTLAASILATARIVHPETLSSEIRSGMDRAVAEMKPRAAALLFTWPQGRSESRRALGVAAALEGHARLGLELMESEDGLECPSCGASLELLTAESA